MSELPRWPDPCRCEPGTEENGWHERRCAMCRGVESKQWADACSRLPEIIRRLKGQP